MPRTEFGEFGPGYTRGRELAEGFLRHRGEARASDALRELKRVPNGRFAPKGTGEILHPGDQVKLPGRAGEGRGVVRANGEIHAAGKRIGRVHPDSFSGKAEDFLPNITDEAREGMLGMKPHHLARLANSRDELGQMADHVEGKGDKELAGKFRAAAKVPAGADEGLHDGSARDHALSGINGLRMAMEKAHAKGQASPGTKGSGGAAKARSKAAMAGPAPKEVPDMLGALRELVGKQGQASPGSHVITELNVARSELRDAEQGYLRATMYGEGEQKKAQQRFNAARQGVAKAEQGAMVLLNSWKRETGHKLALQTLGQESPGTTHKYGPGPKGLSPGRGPTGKLRNFNAMSQNKLEGVVKELQQLGNDPEALSAAQDTHAKKFGQYGDSKKYDSLADAAKAGALPSQKPKPSSATKKAQATLKKPAKATDAASLAGDLASSLNDSQSIPWSDNAKTNAAHEALGGLEQVGDEDLAKLPATTLEQLGNVAEDANFHDLAARARAAAEKKQSPSASSATEKAKATLPTPSPQAGPSAEKANAAGMAGTAGTTADNPQAAALAAYTAAGGDDPAVLAALGGGPAEGEGGDMLPNSQNLSLKDLPIGTKFSAVGGDYTLHKIVGDPWVIAKPTDGGKAKVFHKMMPPTHIGMQSGEAPTQAASTGETPDLFDQLSKSVELAKKNKLPKK